jgi:hypothetical protein
MNQRSQPTDSTDRRLALLLAPALAGAWLACTPARTLAQLYRWVDETGTTVYSQLPPPGSTPAATIKPDAGPKPDQGAAAMEQLRDQVAEDFDHRDQQARDAQAAGKHAAEQAARQTNCEAARKNLETLKNHGGGRLRTPDGKTGFLSKDDLAAQQAQAHKQIEDNCR